VTQRLARNIISVFVLFCLGYTAVDEPISSNVKDKKRETLAQVVCKVANWVLECLFSSHFSDVSSTEDTETSLTEYPTVKQGTSN